MGTLQIFLDETYVADAPAELLAIASLGAFKTPWSRYAKELATLSGVGRSRKLETVRDFVANRRLFAVIGGVRLDALEAGPGVRDLVGPSFEMARRNNAWSHAAAYTAAQLLKRVLENGWLVKQVEVYYDPQDLSPEHREAFHHAFRRVVAQQASQLTRRRENLRSQAITVARIGPVEKPRPKAPSTAAQWGTWLAHWIAKLPHVYAGLTMPSNVEVYDFTPLTAKLFRKSGLLK